MQIFKQFDESEISEIQTGTETVSAWIFPERRSNPKTLSSFGLYPKGKSRDFQDPDKTVPKYFYKVFDRTNGIEESDAAKYSQFTVTYGHEDGKWSPQNNSTKAIYKQYANSILTEDDFGLGGEFYAINLNRRTMRQRIVPSSFEISLYGQTFTASGEDVVRGNEKVGNIYPNKGIILFSPTKLAETDSRLQPEAPQNQEYNHEKLFKAIDSFQLEAEKQVITSTYEVNIGKDEFDASLNPTYSDKNENPGPNPYFTGIGLYSENKRLMAVAKLEEPKKTGQQLSFEIEIEY